MFSRMRPRVDRSHLGRCEELTGDFEDVNLRRLGGCFANPAPWDAVAGLGSVGLAVECVYAAVDPFAVGTVAGW